MKDACFGLEEMEAVRSCRPDDPRHRHLQECPRCRALLASYESFLNPATAPDPVELADAELHLGKRLQQEIQAASHTAGEVAPAPSARTTTTREQPGILRLVRKLRQPSLRPALAMAAVLVVAFGLYRVFELGPSPTGSPVLRGGQQSSADLVEGTGVTLEASGRMLLVWNEHLEADSYEVQLFDADLVMLTDFSVVGATSLDLDSADLTASGVEPRTLFWRVVAFGNGSEIAHSNLQQLPRD